MSSNQPPALYAMYVQATRENSTTKKVARKQWIVFPPITGQSTEVFLLFSREQAAPENRVKWRWQKTDVAEFVDAFPEKLRSLERLPFNNWTVSPLVTAQVSLTELTVLHNEPATPYAVLRRFEKVARAKYGIAI